MQLQLLDLRAKEGNRGRVVIIQDHRCAHCSTHCIAVFLLNGATQAETHDMHATADPSAETDDHLLINPRFRAPGEKENTSS